MGELQRLISRALEDGKEKLVECVNGLKDTQELKDVVADLLINQDSSYNILVLNIRGSCRSLEAELSVDIYNKNQATDFIQRYDCGGETLKIGKTKYIKF